eukprot:GHVU01191598.1.p1 GENE.GHVU01191598.1~~GHVU01191598.1.p1  ORF type:complete len:357 (-),score=23.09 GHVU01191598.1:385-1455(-)
MVKRAHPTEDELLSPVDGDAADDLRYSEVMVSEASRLQFLTAFQLSDSMPTLPWFVINPYTGIVETASGPHCQRPIVDLGCPPKGTNPPPLESDRCGSPSPRTQIPERPVKCPRLNGFNSSNIVAQAGKDGRRSSRKILGGNNGTPSPVASMEAQSALRSPVSSARAKCRCQAQNHTCVYYDRDRLRWVVRWWEGRVHRSKTFGVQKHGEQAAASLALQAKAKLSSQRQLCDCCSQVAVNEDRPLQFLGEPFERESAENEAMQAAASGGPSAHGEEEVEAQTNVGIHRSQVLVSDNQQLGQDGGKNTEASGNEGRTSARTSTSTCASTSAATEKVSENGSAPQVDELLAGILASHT